MKNKLQFILTDGVTIGRSLKETFMHLATMIICLVGIISVSVKLLQSCSKENKTEM